MIKFIKTNYQLFITAILQVMFVSMNVIFISNHRVIPMLLTGFMISLIWTFNIKKVAFGGLIDRFIYATGAMIGTGLGYLISAYINSQLK